MTSTAPAMAVELDVPALFREHGAFIARVVRRLSGDGAHVDDLVQETFLIAHRKRDSFEGRSAPSTWLYGITAHLCMRHNRGGRRFRGFLERLVRGDVAPPVETPETEIGKRQDVALVREVIAGLPFKMREAFVLYELEGLEGTRIGELLGIAEGTVWRRVHEARKLFKERMQKRTRKEGSP